MQPGPYQLFVQRAGFLNQVYYASRIPGQPSAGVRSARESATPLETAAGAQLRDTEIRVVRAPAFRITGTVMGIPAGATATVGVVPNDGVSTTPEINTVVSPGNQFELRGVLWGGYTDLIATFIQVDAIEVEQALHGYLILSRAEVVASSAPRMVRKC